MLFDPATPGANCSFGNAGHIALDHIRPLARPDVMAGVPGMMMNPLGPLVLRWRGVPGLTPWLGRFAAAARPGRVRAGDGGVGGVAGIGVGGLAGFAGWGGVGGDVAAAGGAGGDGDAAGVLAGLAEGRALKAHGVGFEDLSGAETRDLAPGLLAEPAGGRLFRQAAHVVNPFRLVQALAERVVADGGTLVQAGVSGFRREGGRVMAVQTAGGGRRRCRTWC